MTKNQIIKYLLEDALGLNESKNNYLILEEISNTDINPDYDKMVAYYTRYNAPKNSFEELSDKEKNIAISTVNDIVNGSVKKMTHPLNSQPSDLQTTIINMLCAEYIHPNDKVDGWEPENVDTQNIYEFILSFYNPYKGNSQQLSYPAMKAIPRGSGFEHFNIDNDIVIDAFTESIKDLLFDKKYDPDKSSFDYTLTQFSMRNNIIDLLRKKTQQKDIGLPMIQSTGDEDDSEFDVRSTFGQKDPEISIMSDSDKFDYIKSKLDENEKKVLEGFFKFIFSETPNEEMASKKLIDLLSDEDGDITNVDADEVSYKGKESLNDFVAKEFGKKYDESTMSYIKVAISRTRSKLLTLFKNPYFRRKIGIEDWSEKDLDILKGTSQQTRDWKKAKNIYKTGDDYENKSIAYDKFGKPLPTDEKGRIIPKSERGLSEIMFECISNTKNNFDYRFNKINYTLDKINKINYFINEGFDIAVKDLDQDIYNYLNETVDGLNKAYYVLNELEILSNDIRFDYPDVSEEILNQVRPLMQELENITIKVKDVKKHLKPFLSETSYVKKKDIDLDEERITNPESKEYVKRRENFIGSHIYGEDLGGLGKMYVTYSYGEQFPVYLWYKDKWYHNANDYKLEDGTINEPTNQHKQDMRPVQDTHSLSTLALNTMISKFKKKHGLGDNVHTDVEPGEKN